MRIASSALDLPSGCRCHGIEGKGGRVETKVARDKKPQKYPKCGKGNAIVHGRVKRSARHAPVKSKLCMLVVDLRRYRCKKCGKTFFEPPPVVSGASPHVTVGPSAWMVGQVRLRRSFSEITRGCGASADIIQRVVDAAPPPKLHLPRHLYVDEFRAFSKHGAREGSTKRFWTVFVDGSDGRLVDVIEAHDKRAVEARLRKLPKGERFSAKAFACSISSAFWRAAKTQLSNATVRPGKSHAIELVKNALGNARRRIAKRSGKSTADVKRALKLLVADRARLCQNPQARHWQSQEELDAKAA